jgi:hypothetical protein
MNKTEEWVSSASALSLLAQTSAHPEPTELLLRRLSAGILGAKAQKYTTAVSSDCDTAIPPGFWGGSKEPFAELDWIAGDFAFGLSENSRAAYGVRFRRDQMDQISDIARASAKSTTISGTRRYDKWDDLLIEVGRALFLEDLKPRRQSDIVNFMLDWATQHEFDVGETSIKKRAHKLWQGIGDAARSRGS